MLHLRECYRGGLDGRAGWWLKFRLPRGEQPEGDAFTDAIAALKASVPPGERSYNPETFEWWISDQWAAEVTSLIPALELHLKQPALPGFGS